MRVLLALLVLGCLSLGVAAFGIHASSELTPIFGKDIALSTAADGVSLVESEAEAGAQWEFPSPAFCSSSQDPDTGAWAMANRLYEAAHAGTVSDRTDVITQAAAVPLVPCPSVTHTGAAPVFKACCATHKHERFAANDMVDFTYGCKDIPSTPELVAKYDEWRNHADKGELPVSKFLKLQCPQNPASRQTVRKVCESELDCPDSGSDKGKCCWSLFAKAPGMCFTKKCPHLTSEIKGRCDSDSDCHRLRLPDSGRLVCCNNGGIFKSSTRRRGFCVPPTECKASELAFDCGHENKCTIGARFRFNKHKADKAKCCQSLKPTMSLRPDRQCLQACEATQVDVTDKPVSALIPTLPLLAPKDGDSPEARSYNMMRFAQIASKVFEMNGDTDTFLAVQKKRTLRDGCESSSNNMYKTGGALALHTANSLLTAISPFLLLDMARNTPNSEKFQANVNSIPGVQLTKGAVKTAAQPFQYASILSGIKDDLYGNTADAKQLFAILLGFAPNTVVPEEVDLIAKLEKFFHLFSIVPINKLHGADPPADVDPSWFNRLTKAFGDLSSAILTQCKKQIIAAGAFTEDVTDNKFPDYVTITSWIKDRSLFQASLEDADPALSEADKKTRTAAFAQSRVCYSLWPRLGFGTHFLKDTFKNEMQELHEKLEIVGRVATIAGSLASSVSFGGSPAAAKVIRFGLKKYEEKKKKIQAATDAALDDLVAETIKDIPKDYNSACANFVNRGKLFSYPYNYDRLCPSSSGEKDSDKEFEKLPAHLQLMVKATCTKALAIRKKKHALIKKYNEEPSKTTAKAMTQKELINDHQAQQDKLLKQVTELYGGCTWTNDLDAQIGAMQSFFNYSLSLISCNREKIGNDKVDENARTYFEEKIVAITPDQDMVWQMYDKMMEPSIALKIAGSVLDIFELAEPVMSNTVSMTFGQLTAIAEAKTHILQEMKRAGIDVKVTMPTPSTTTQAATTTPTADTPAATSL